MAVVVGSVVGDGRRIVRGKNGIVEVPVGTSSSSVSLVIRTGPEGLLEGEVELGGGASRWWGVEDL